MKCISLWQPYASLISLGIKRIETRGWPTSYRGPLAIHASKSVGVSLIRGASIAVGDFTIENDTLRGSHAQYLIRGPSMAWPYRLPLGAVVATCELVDVLPMVDVEAVRHVADPSDLEPHLLVEGLDNQMFIWDGMTAYSVESQRPYGIYEAGRFAWLLDNIKPLTKPIPAVGRQGLWEWDTSALAIAEGITA